MLSMAFGEKWKGTKPENSQEPKDQLPSRKNKFSFRIVSNESSEAGKGSPKRWSTVKPQPRESFSTVGSIEDGTASRDGPAVNYSTKSKSSRRRVEFLGTSATAHPWILFFFRSFAFVFCFIQLIFWYMSTNWAKQPPVLFYTNWGFILCISYFLCAAVCSGMKVCTTTRKLPNWFYLMVCGLFELAIVTECSISALYWTLIFPSSGECGLICITAHALSTFCLLMDFLMNRHYLLARHLKRVYALSFFWLSTQVGWVYTGHTAIYGVLTLRDELSVIVIMGATFIQAVVFYALQRVGKLRDQINGDKESTRFELDDLDDLDVE